MHLLSPEEDAMAPKRSFFDGFAGPPQAVVAFGFVDALYRAWWGIGAEESPPPRGDAPGDVEGRESASAPGSPFP